MKLQNILTGREFNFTPEMYKDLVNSGKIKNFKEITEIPENLIKIKEKGSKIGFGTDLIQKNGEFFLGKLDENGNNIEDTIPENGIFDEIKLEGKEFKMNIDENKIYENKFDDENWVKFEEDRKKSEERMINLEKFKDDTILDEIKNDNLNEDFDNETEMDNQIGDFDLNKNEEEIFKSLEVKTEKETSPKKSRGPYKKNKE